MDEKRLIELIRTVIQEEISPLKEEFHEFRQEMNDFKNQMVHFRDEMYQFRNDMVEFKAEMYEFRTEVYQRFDRLEEKVDNNLTESRSNFKYLERLYNDQRSALEVLNQRISEHDIEIKHLKDDVSEIKQILAAHEE